MTNVDISTTEDQLFASQNYLLQQARREAAYQLYNYAGAHLEHARIMERLAEIRSQHEPMASLLTEDILDRDKLYAIATYVATGRKFIVELKENKK